MLSPNELAAQIRSTEAFVDADPVDLSIYRSTRVSNGAGGYVKSTPALTGTVRCRLIPQSDRVPEVSTLDGRLLRPKFVLMASPGVNVERGDTFTFGSEYEIAAVHEGPEYAFKADVVRRG